MNPDKIPKIRVLIRKRPISKKQVLKGDKDIVIVQNNQTITLREQKVKVDLTPYTDEYRFNFDGAYDQRSTNQQIYGESIKPLVDCAFDGARVSCFAYGQTGSGKTYTMLGDGQQVYGLYLLAACDIFQQITKRNDLEVWVSFYEIYCSKLFDLLNERSVLVPREDAKNNVNIVGLSEKKISNVKNLMQAIQIGMSSRVTAENGTNVDSSRSHAILQISLKSGKKIHGKISFIDLAGSQRAADHADQIQKQTRIDGAQINKSLLALKQCIRALDQNKSHTPFRGSKLTMVLKDSFTGYCKTVMIGNISPNSSSSQNTLNTLKYADRVKQLKKPIKDACQPADGDNLDQLSKQLMLPRQLVHHVRYRSNQKSANKSINISTPKKQIVNINNVSLNSDNKKRDIVGKNEKNFVNNISKDSSNRNNKKKQKQNRLNNLLAPNKQQQRPRTSHNISNSMKNDYLIQQKEPFISNFESFQQLSKKHQQAVASLVIHEKQLFRQHENHVNSSISLVKKQMELLKNNDDPDINMQDYLETYDKLLEKQMQDLIKIREKVKKVKEEQKRSEKIQWLYVEQLSKMHQNDNDSLDQQEDLLLDNNETLFKD